MQCGRAGAPGSFPAAIDVGADTARIVSVSPLERSEPSREFPESYAAVQFLRGDDTVISAIKLRVKESTCCETRPTSAA